LTCLAKDIQAKGYVHHAANSNSIGHVCTRTIALARNRQHHPITMIQVQQRSFSNSSLGKRYASEMTSQLEAALTEFYRRECLRALHTGRTAVKPVSAKRKRVKIAPTPEIIGRADPLVDRRPIDVSPISQLEMILILSQRTFPIQEA
jgi:hypothetical protein